MMERKPTNDFAQEKREKRAKSIAAMGLVARINHEKFTVSTPSLRGKQTSFTVHRREDGEVVCNCLEFEEEFANNPDGNFACEHILAVGYFLAEKIGGVK